MLYRMGKNPSVIIQIVVYHIKKSIEPKNEHVNICPQYLVSLLAAIVFLSTETVVFI